MGQPDDHPAQRFAAALLAFEEQLDWRRLEDVYCWEEGEGFFGEEQRDALREAGLLIAGDLADELGALPAGPARSLYVGPGVAELAPILCERLVLGREVLAVTLAGPEAEELARAGAAVGARVGCELFTLHTDWSALPERPCDHGWLVSVLTDPEAFPALHDALYERRGELATGRGDLARERERAGGLLEHLLARLAPGALLTTTDEELPLVAGACRRRGWELVVPELARLSPVVGDPVRHCRIAASGG